MTKDNEIRPKTGNCMFCGQSRMIELTEDEWLDRIATTNKSAQELADAAATEQCICKEGAEWRTTLYVLEDCKRNIEEMFRDSMPEMADVLQEARPMIWEQKLKRITVTTHEGGTASMYRSGGNMEVKFIQKNEAKLTTSW